MKLHEIKLGEGLVDTSVFNVVRQVCTDGITNGAQTVALAKCILAIQAGKVGIADNFNEYYNTFFPTKELINEVKTLSKENAQQLATFILRVLELKDTQLASLATQTADIQSLLYYACAAEAND
jgi:type VI protein secretion system component VasF